MNSTEFSVGTLTEQQAQEIAAAYIKGDKDPPRMAKILGVDQFDLNILMHPLVRRFVVQFQRAIASNYSLDDHMDQLKKIRDAAFDDENWKIALSAETQLGKAAGHYDPKPLGDDPNNPDNIDPAKLSTDELRRRLARSIGAVIPTGTADELPAPDSDSSEADDDEDMDADEVERGEI